MKFSLVSSVLSESETAVVKATADKVASNGKRDAFNAAALSVQAAAPKAVAFNYGAATGLTRTALTLSLAAASKRVGIKIAWVQTVGDETTATGTLAYFLVASDEPAPALKNPTDIPSGPAK